MDGVRWLTYDEVAAALGIGSESARVLVRRKRWPRRPGNDGKARIGVPEDAIAARTGPPADRANSPPNDPPNGPPSDRPSDPPSDRGSEPDQLTEIRILNARLEVRIEALQAVVDAEQVRAARERQLLEKAIEEVTAQRDRWAAVAERLTQQAPPTPQAERRGWWPFRRAS